MGYKAIQQPPTGDTTGENVVAINPKKITGKWRSGVTLDVHTISSVYLGVNESGHEVYDNTSSGVGELLYRLKYSGNMTAAREIIKTAAAYLKPHRAKFDLIVPVPPSGKRAVQPVITLAKGIGEALGIPVAACVTTTRPATQLKGVIDPDKRKELLIGLYRVDRVQTKGKNILLFDDLYRSGSTLNAITEVLLKEGKAATVRAFAITRTRSKQ
jgi:predicted amidophosphoribosyltransferase